MPAQRLLDIPYNTRILAVRGSKRKVIDAAYAAVGACGVEGGTQARAVAMLIADAIDHTNAIEFSVEIYARGDSVLVEAWQVSIEPDDFEPEVARTLLRGIAYNFVGPRGGVR